MREIEFKAKRIDNGEWVYGMLDTCFMKNQYFINYWVDKLVCEETNTKKPFHESLEVDPKTICQFTGFYDSKGNKIYEWDILNDNYEVYYSLGKFKVRPLKIGLDHKNILSDFIWYSKGRLLITGNKHD